MDEDAKAQSVSYLVTESKHYKVAELEFKPKSTCNVLDSYVLTQQRGEAEVIIKARKYN